MPTFADAVVRVELPDYPADGFVLFLVARWSWSLCRHCGQEGKGERPRIRDCGVGFGELCVCDVLAWRRRGHEVDLFGIRSAVANASVLHVEALDTRVWQVQLVGVEEFQKAGSPSYFGGPLHTPP